MALEKLKSLSWFFQLLILAGVAGLVVLAVEMVYFRDLTTKIEDQQNQLAAMKSDLANVREVEKRHQMFQQANAKLEKQLAELHSVLPDDREVDVLIHQLQDIASRNNVRLLRMVAKQVTTRETSANASSQDASGKKPEAQPRLYSELPFTLELSGAYSGLGMFFDRLAHMQRIVNITDIQIASVTNTGKVKLKAQPPKGLTDTVVATCTLTTYFQSEP